MTGSQKIPHTEIPEREICVERLCDILRAPEEVRNLCETQVLEDLVSNGFYLKCLDDGRDLSRRRETPLGLEGSGFQMQSRL